MTLSRNCLELRIKRWNSSGAVLRVKAGQGISEMLLGSEDLALIDRTSGA